MFGASTLSAAKEIPYANALERWQNDLRSRPGRKHPYSDYACGEVADDEGLYMEGDFIAFDNSPWSTMHVASRGLA